MTTTLYIFAAAAILIAAAVYIVRRRVRPTEHSERHPTVGHTIVPLHSRLQPGDVVSILHKSRRPERGTRETVFQGRVSDGRMILRTSPWCREFRRPVDDLVSVVRTGKRAA